MSQRFIHMTVVYNEDGSANTVSVSVGRAGMTTFDDGATEETMKREEYSLTSSALGEKTRAAFTALEKPLLADIQTERARVAAVAKAEAQRLGKEADMARKRAEEATGKTTWPR